MSFILDALRKSESERRRSSVPGIAHVPLAVARPGLPRWAVAVMVLLGASAVVMGVAWWMAIDADDERPRTVSVPLELAPPQPSSASLPPGPPPALARLSDSSLRSAAAVPDAAAAGAAAPPSTAPAPAATDPDPAAYVPSAAELEAEGTELPDLRLELHVYAATPAGRYVFVNGNMYREGETLREGPQLLRIDPQGAVLRHQGREFLLAQ